VQGCETAQEAEDIAEYATRVFMEMNRQVHMEDVQEKHDFIKEHIQKLRDKICRRRKRPGWPSRRSTASGPTRRWIRIWRGWSTP
jgi:hypothetical protein